MKRLKFTLLFVIALITLNSCSSDDNEKVEPQGDYANGYFVTNEGPFNNGTGTITFVGDDRVVKQSIYKTVNNKDLGNIVQSMALSETRAFILVNNSDKIVVVDRFTFQEIGIIEGTDEIKSPRYIVIKGDRAYVSNWGDPASPDDDFITVIDLINNEIINTISVGEGPEDMLISGSKLYVNLQGGWGHNNKLAVIDLNSETVVKNITVGDVPNSIHLDSRGMIWVLSGGIPAWTGNETNGVLLKINPGSDEIISDIIFEDDEHPDFLTENNGDLLFAMNGKVYAISPLIPNPPLVPVQGIEGSFYSMRAHNNELYVTDAKDFQSEGELHVYSIVSGTLLETINTGIVPGSVVFQSDSE